MLMYGHPLTLDDLDESCNVLISNATARSFRCALPGCVTMSRLICTTWPSKCVRLRSKPRSAWDYFNIPFSLGGVDERAHLVNPDRLLPIQRRLLPPPRALIFPALDAEDNIAWLPIRALVGLALEDGLPALGRTLRDLDGVYLRVLEYLRAAAVRAHACDNAAAPATVRACHLRLRVHPRHDLLAHDLHTGAVARGAGVHVRRGRRAAAPAVVAEDAFPDGELRRAVRGRGQRVYVCAYIDVCAVVAERWAR